jgi:hypothetical protein
MDNEVEMQPWDRMEGEPGTWYRSFRRYYITLGYLRTIRGAYLDFLKDVGDQAEAEYARTPDEWYVMANQWNWKARADAWDDHIADSAVTAVEEAAIRLKLATVNAVDTLISALTGSERYRVNAAKEILDRGGLPATVRQEQVTNLSFTADDLARAKDELKQWEQESQPNKSESE